MFYPSTSMLTHSLAIQSTVIFVLRLQTKGQAERRGAKVNSWYLCNAPIFFGVRKMSYSVFP